MEILISFKRRADNKAIVINDQHENASTFRTNSTNNDHGKNIVANVNLKHTFDTTGKELTADIDYGTYHSNSLSTNGNPVLIILDGSPMQADYILNGDQ